MINSDKLIINIKDVLNWEFNSDSVCVSVVIRLNNEISICLFGDQAAKFSTCSDASELFDSNHLTWLAIDGRVGVLTGFNFNAVNKCLLK